MVEIEERCATLLRQLRNKRGLTLRECEIESGGKFKAVVMGSYERGTRAISLERLQEIAEFYEVPVQYFFDQLEKPPYTEDKKYTFDLRKLKNSPYFDASFARVAELLKYYMEKRRDWNGEILSIRKTDGEMLALISGDSKVIEKLELHGIFFDLKS